MKQLQKKYGKACICNGLEREAQSNRVLCKFIADFTLFFYNFFIFTQWPRIFDITHTGHYPTVTRKLEEFLYILPEHIENNSFVK